MLLEGRGCVDPTKNRKKQMQEGEVDQWWSVVSGGEKRERVLFVTDIDFKIGGDGLWVIRL